MPKRKKQQQQTNSSKSSHELGKKKVKTVSTVTGKSGKTSAIAVSSSVSASVALSSSGPDGLRNRSKKSGTPVSHPTSINQNPHHSIRLRPKTIATLKTAEEVVNQQLSTPEGQIELIDKIRSNQSLGCDLIQSVNSHVDKIVETVKLKKRFKKKSRSVQIQELENSKIDLSSPDSILCSINLSNVINRTNFLKLPSYYQFCLLKVLPKSDQMILPNNITYPDPKAFNNDYFSRALNSFSTRLMEGRLTTEAITRVRKELERGKTRLDPLKIKYFEPHFKLPEDQLPHNLDDNKQDHVRTGVNYLGSIVEAYCEYKKLYTHGVTDMELVNRFYTEMRMMEKLKVQNKNKSFNKVKVSLDDRCNNVDSQSEDGGEKARLSLLIPQPQPQSQQKPNTSIARRKRKGDDPYINGIKDSKSDRIVTEIITDLFEDQFVSDYTIIPPPAAAAASSTTTTTTTFINNHSLPNDLSGQHLSSHPNNNTAKSELQQPLCHPNITSSSNILDGSNKYYEVLDSMNHHLDKLLLNGHQIVPIESFPSSFGSTSNNLVQLSGLNIPDQYFFDETIGVNASQLPPPPPLQPPSSSSSSTSVEDSHFDEVRFFIENICIQTIKKIAALLRLWVTSSANLLVATMHYELLANLKQTVMKQLSSSIKCYQFVLTAMYKFVKFGKIKSSDALKLEKFRLEPNSNLPWEYNIGYREHLPPNGMSCFHPLNDNFFKKMLLKADKMFALCNRMVDVKPILAEKMFEHFEAAAQLRMFHRWAITAIDMSINITDPERRDILLRFSTLYN